MPLLIGIRDGPREWRQNVSLGLKMPVAVRGRGSRLVEMYPMSREATGGLPKGVNGNMLHGTCHFEARPWGGPRITGQKFFSKPR